VYMWILSVLKITSRSLHMMSGVFFKLFLFNFMIIKINISKKKLIISILNKKFIYINIDKNFQ